MRLGIRRRTTAFLKQNADIAWLYLKKISFRPIMLDSATAEEMVKALHASLTAAQKAEICLAWDYADAERGLVRSFIANHWQVTRPCIRGHFFSAAQRSLILQIYLGLLAPKWRRPFIRQLSDDTYGHRWGQDQSIAIFGDPAAGPYQFAFTGRHCTLRVNGNPNGALAFGGPIVYAHAATGYWEKPHHPHNIFWPQARAASRLYATLNDAQRVLAERERLPAEEDIGFRPAPTGVPVSMLNPEQQNRLRDLLDLLLQPFRAADREAVMRCLHAQGGIEKLHLAYGRANRMSAPDWDDWRLEGPAFIWHYRGWPHVHAWVHIADRVDIAANARTGTYIFPGQDPLR